jgi:DNA-binding YbaB/EbfC family protein
MSADSPQGMAEILAKAQAVQGKLAEVQRELATRRFEGAAGGGMVTAVVTGELRVLEIRIEPSLFTQGDRDMIQDLCAAATNAALGRAQQGVQEEMQRVAGNLGLPNLGAFGPSGSGA